MPRPQCKQLTPQSLKVLKDKAEEAQRRQNFRLYCRHEGLEPPVEDYRFAAPDRQWMIDLSWPTVRVGIEVQGGVWVKGAHSRGAQQIKDFEKLNAAQVRGWIVLQVTPDQLCTAETLALVRMAMNVNLAA